MSYVYNWTFHLNLCTYLMAYVLLCKILNRFLEIWHTCFPFNSMLISFRGKTDVLLWRMYICFGFCVRTITSLKNQLYIYSLVQSHNIFSCHIIGMICYLNRCSFSFRKWKICDVLLVIFVYTFHHGKFTKL